MTSPTDLQQMQPQMPPQQPQKQPEDRGSDTPMQMTPEQAQQAAGLSEEDKKNLIKTMNHFTQKWSWNHRGNIMRVSKVFEYIRDRQYVYWDSRAGKFTDPFSDDGTNKDDAWGYRYQNNIMQWLLRVFVSTLSKGQPVPRFWPVDAENDEDVASSEEASKASAAIARQNNAKSLLRQCLMYLFASGNYFRYVRWLRDSDRAGVSKEPVWTLEESEIEPARFICPQCGATVPAEQVQSDSTPCPQCGHALDEGDFHEPVTGPVPKIVGMDEVPNGQVCFSLYNTLHVIVSPDATDPSIDPVTSTPILRLDDETDVSSLRASYPDAWDLVKQANTTSTAGGDQETARLARTRNYTANPGRAGAINDGKTTLTRCWIRETAFNCLDKKEDADRLRSMFPDGVKLVTVGDKFLEAVPEKLTDHWTWCGTMKGYGAYPPSVADPAMPFQDRINDNANNAHQYYDRLANPDVLANVDLIDVEAWNGQPMSGGGFKPVKLKSGRGASSTLEGAFYQPKFSTDHTMASYNDALMAMVQLIIGCLPQTYGGHQQGVDTMGGQQQALDTASGILGIYWDLITEEHANAAKIGVKCLAQNALDDLKNPQIDEDGDGGFKNDTIQIDKLKGEFNCYPDVDQGIPVSAVEWRNRLQEVLTSKDNALTMELLQPMPNRVLAMKAWAPPGMKVPGKDTWDAVVQDIGVLMQSGPLPPNPVPDPITGQVQMVVMPTVQPVKDLYDMSVAVDCCKEWGMKNWHTTLEQNPAGRENFLAYLRLVSQYQSEASAAQMPPGPPQPAQA